MRAAALVVEVEGVATAAEYGFVVVVVVIAIVVIVVVEVVGAAVAGDVVAIVKA